MKLAIMQDVFFSIIVPVYKVELFLEQCVNSILEQTFLDYELILIDDGSPDSCPAICDQLANKDSKICVIHKENGGLSSARNTGLQVATGKYVIFLDSDDYYGRRDALQMMQEELITSNADILILKAQKYYMKSETLSDCEEISSTQDILKMTYGEQLSYSVSRQLYDTCAWNKVFRRSMMLYQNLYFTEGIIAEDIDWCARLCLVAKSLAILKLPVYVYRKGRDGAITSSLKLKNLIDTKSSIERCIEYVKNIKLDDAEREAYFSYVAYRYVIWMAEAAAVKDNGKRELVQKMQMYDWLLGYKLNNKVRVVHSVYGILGYRITAFILRLYLLNREN